MLATWLFAISGRSGRALFVHDRLGVALVLAMLTNLIVCIAATPCPTPMQSRPPSIGPQHVAGDLFGTTVANAGDVDADGAPDVLVASGAWGEHAFEDPAAIVFSGATGKRLLAVGRGWDVNRFDNRSACGVGDVNHDGHADFALVAWHPAGIRPGYFATVFSGVDGRELWSSPLEGPRQVYGLSICRVHDVDGDGIADMGVAICDQFERRGAGSVELISGASGCTIAHSSEDLSGRGWRGPMAALGDADGTDPTDLVIVLRHAFSSVDVRSGLDLRRIRSFDSMNCDGACAAGDVDRDGVEDVLVFGRQDVPSAEFEFRTFVEAVSGRDASRLWRFANPPNTAKGWDACSLGDVDGDGWRDVAFSEYDFCHVCAGVWLLSGRSGEPLRNFPMPKDPFYRPWHFGYALADAGDVDNDGHADVVIGIATPWGMGTGCVEVRSGWDGALLRRWTRESTESEPPTVR